MLPMNLHTIEPDENHGDRSGRPRGASGTVSLFLRDLGHALATPRGDTRGHVRPYCPELFRQHERL